MKIAILGTRGIPANYGGFETFVEELAPRLVKRGHDVTVYCRSNNVNHSSSIYRGVRLVVLPTIATKHLDTVAHTFLSVFHSLAGSFDVMLMCNAANALLCAVPRLAGTSIALNVDGVERKRKKWGPAGRLYYRLSEHLATFIPTVIVTDAEVMRDYYLKEHRASSVMIAYGADCSQSGETAFIRKLGLQVRNYILYVSRFEPENNVHVAIDAYNRVHTDKPLVIVGDAPYSVNYIKKLRSMADERVIFTGAIYGEHYLELRSHAYAWIQATEVGGTHPALLEAMGAGNCILAKKTPEHVEVLGDTGLYFDTAEDLAALIRRVIDEPQLAQNYREQTRSRAKDNYSWEAITGQYEELFLRMTRNT